MALGKLVATSDLAIFLRGIVRIVPKGIIGETGPRGHSNEAERH
jgi:hypothetical protein